MKSKIIVKECFLEGWDCFKENPWAIIVSIILNTIFLALITLLMQQLFNPLKFPIMHILSFITFPIILGNILFVTLKTAKKELSNSIFIFLDLKTMLKMGCVCFFQWLLMGIPSIISIGMIYLALYTQKIPFEIVVFTGIISMVLSIYVMYRLFFTFYIILDYENISVIDAFKKSMLFSKGQFLKFASIYFIACLIFIIGSILFVIPGIIGYIVSMIAISRFYLKIKESHDGQTYHETPKKHPVLS